MAQFASRDNGRAEGNRISYVLIAHRLTPGANIYFADLPRWPDPDEIEHSRKVMSRLARLRA
jgi:hypothetical protein